jgi:hypothetical protein
VTKVGESIVRADTAQEEISLPAGRVPDWTPFVLGGRKKVQGGIQKGGKRRPKADHKDPQNTPPSVANFGPWWDRRGESELKVSGKVSRGEKRVSCGRVTLKAERSG